LTESYLKKRSLKGNEASFLEAMSKVPDIKPVDEDEL
jgi:hypothetical protein